MGARIMSICISPYDQDRVWIGFGYMGDYSNICKSTHRIIETTDGGRFWQNASNGLPIFPIHDIVFYKGSYETLFAATDQGVYYRRAGGYKWQRFSDYLPNTLIGELNINYCRGKLTAATYGRGLWETDLPPIEDKNVLKIRRKKVFEAPEGEEMVLSRDIKLSRRGRLQINCPVHIHKGGKISVRRKRQIQFGPNGKIVNNCGEKWLGFIDR
jgi:hypothetical protein